MPSLIRLSINGWISQRWLTVGLSMTAIFGDFGGYFFGNVRDKTNTITWRYATLCRPVIDCKMNNL